MPTRRIEINTTFTRNSIGPCYVVKTRSGEFWMTMVVDNGTMILTKGDGNNWEYLSRWDINLCYSYSSCDPNFHELDIMEVYGQVCGTENYHGCGYVTPDYRPLLWSREPERVEMTLEEIEKKLGYKIKVVSEKES